METIKFKESPKHRVNKIIAWLCSLGYLAIVVIAFIGLADKTLMRLFSCIREGFNFTILTSLDQVLLCSSVLILVFLLFCWQFFEWSLNPVLVVEKDKVLFKTDDVIAAMGRATTTYTIKKVERFKETKNSIKVYGEISRKEPLGKDKVVKKCELVGLYDKEDKSKVLEVIGGMVSND